MGAEASTEALEQCDEPEIAADRYRIVALLGRGGAATVSRAFDPAAKRDVALKRLIRREANSSASRNAELFEREFYTLSQLRHPRIVQVYDYAVDDYGPFYTMELLDGGDLQGLAPMYFRLVCSVARDVCSALSLVHSRRLVHRDVSPRNIRCGNDGRAKLLDFGALMRMGPSKGFIVGTPPCTAPEALQRSSLDARTDLYSLGATLYYALTGRHAYPARTFADLAAKWERAPAPPSDFVAGVPPMLDALVLELLELDPGCRPASAAEVIERLCAIEGIGATEHLLEAQAYLCTPVIVGRGAELRRISRWIPRAASGRGATFAVEGASGVGRSRFLDACALDAKLQGAVVARANADDAQSGSFGALGAVAKSLFAAHPRLALEHANDQLEILSSAVPELEHSLGPSADDGAGSTDGLRWPEAVAHQAIRDWLRRISREKPLFIAIDDLHRLDAPSLASIAMLSDDPEGQSMLLVATVCDGACENALPALTMFLNRARRQRLENLRAEETLQLLKSVFGDVPNVELAAARIAAGADGNPRDTLQLAQHLVDRGLARYEAGSWTLPVRLDTGALPSNMTQALGTRLAHLSGSARELATTVSLEPGLAVSFEECSQIIGGHRSTAVEALEELLRAEVLRPVGDCFELAQATWAKVLSDAAPEEMRKFHLRLARLYECRPGTEFRTGKHLIRGGALEDGVAVLARQSEALESDAHRDAEHFAAFVRSLPADWYEVYAEALALRADLGRPRKEEYLLRSRIAALASALGTTDNVHLPALLGQLCEASGLSDWERFEGLDPQARLMKALGAAKARYEQTPERDRVLDPRAAIRQLARVLIQTAAVLTSRLDVSGARGLPCLAPLVPLSPSLGVIELLIEGMVARMSGRAEQALAAYAKVLDRTNDPDRAGLDESHHANMRFGLMGGFGMVEAAMGLKSSLDWAKLLESEPLYQVNALNILMLYHLWQGDLRRAVHHKKEVEYLRIQENAQHFFEGTHLLWEVTALSAIGDLTRMKHAVTEIESFAKRYPGWRPVHCYALGEYHRVRGDLDRAERKFEEGLASTTAGQHQIWINLAGGHIGALREAGRTSEALALGRAYLAAARDAQLGYALSYLLMPFSQVLAATGEHEEAVGMADEVIATFRTLGTTGVNLGLAYETRARVALELRDVENLEAHAELMKKTFEGVTNPALSARCERLCRAVRGVESGASSEFVQSIDAEHESKLMSAMSRIESCGGPLERAKCVLSCIAESSQATAGYLFLVGEREPRCAAALDDAEAPAAIKSMARSYLAAQVSEFRTMTCTDSISATSARYAESTDGFEPSLRTVLLSHSVNDGMAISGVAILSVPVDVAFVAPARLVAYLSEAVQESGDATSIVLMNK